MTAVVVAKYDAQESRDYLYFSAISYCNATEVSTAFNCHACHLATKNATVFKTMNGTQNTFALVVSVLFFCFSFGRFQFSIGNNNSIIVYFRNYFHFYSLYIVYLLLIVFILIRSLSFTF
jgi:hypothetical protein